MSYWFINCDKYVLLMLDVNNRNWMRNIRNSNETMANHLPAPLCPPTLQLVIHHCFGPLHLFFIASIKDPFSLLSLETWNMLLPDSEKEA